MAKKKLNLESSKKMTGPSAYQIIQKKRDGKKLTADEIRWFVHGLLNGTIENYQMSALLMAIYIKGMSKEETAALTDAMLYSGDVITFKNKNVIDKHSTGGVGDKTSFIIAPIAAAAGVKVPMIAGRGLGHTGGTVDKIEAIPGFKTELSLDDFSKRVEKNGIVLMGQTSTLAPADKKIYALRDVTATIESIPLITASIMSKKLAEGAQGIVMDIKTGNGAFMKKTKDAKALAKSLRETAKRFNRPMMTYITDMSKPLGQNIGHTLEIIESIETLKGRGPKDLTKLSLELAAAMIFLGKKAASMPKARLLAQKILDSGQALNKFKEMIEWQGGDSNVINDYTLMPLAKEITIVKSDKKGHIKDFQNEKIGLLCVELGGGRAKANDKIDLGVGFTFYKTVGDEVEKGTPILAIHHHSHQKQLVQNISQRFLNEVISISKRPSKAPRLILETKLG